VVQSPIQMQKLVSQIGCAIAPLWQSCIDHDAYMINITCDAMMMQDMVRVVDPVRT
jgi:hypothetical protein